MPAVPEAAMLPAERAASLVARHGSPLYVYDAPAVRAAYRALVAAFAYSPLDAHYAIVCNKNRYLVRALAELGAGVHASTPGDAHAALAAGIPADRIVYSGSNLDARDLDYVVGRGLRLNLDSVDQVGDVTGRGGLREVGLRLLVDDDERLDRIGVTRAELPEAVRRAREGGVRITGLHMYAGTNTRRVDRFLECFDRLLAASDALDALEFLDLGGGYGVSYRDGEAPLDVATLGREVAARMRALSAARGRAVRLLLEPGRILVAAAGTLLMRVVSVKHRGGRRYVGTDATVGNVAVESVYHPFHRVDALAARSPALDVPTQVCGNTTHSRDYLARECRLPALEKGDLLALRDVGAYGYAVSSHFLNRPRPAEVVLDGEAEHLTTRRETLDDLLDTQVGA
ncbi:MAG: decarboxylase [Acidobacteria bacterium]|nr:MAG: decarboxylase [Acidobacteriota bacterium]